MVAKKGKGKEVKVYVTKGLKKCIRRFGKIEFTRQLSDKVGFRISHQALNNWIVANRMPASEFRGTTQYSKAIEELTGGDVTVIQLLGWAVPTQDDAWPKK